MLSESIRSLMHESMIGVLIFYISTEKEIPSGRWID